MAGVWGQSAPALLQRLQWLPLQPLLLHAGPAFSPCTGACAARAVQYGFFSTACAVQPRAVQPYAVHEQMRGAYVRMGL